MAGKWSELLANTALTGAEYWAAIQAGSLTPAVQLTVNDIAGFIASGTPIFNVRDYPGFIGDGFLSDQLAIDAALADALAAKGLLYFPGSPNDYRGSISVADHLSLRIKGDGYFASTLTRIDAARNTLEVTGTVSGSSGDIHISDMAFTCNTAGKLAIYIHHVIGFTMTNVRWLGMAAIDGSQGGPHNNCWGYGGQTTGLSALRLGVDDIAITGTGPMEWIGGQMAILSSAAGTTIPVVEIIGNVMNCSFHGTQFAGYPVDEIVTINGLTGQTTAYGCIDFYNTHTESCFNMANTCSQFAIGKNSPFGQVGFHGGNYFGQGDGTNYCAQMIKLYSAACRDLVVDRIAVSKQASANGFSVAAIRMEAGSLGVGQQRTFRDIVPLNSIPVFSDAGGLFNLYGGNETTATKTRAEIFTASGTATKPPGATLAHVFLISGGPGGGSGRRGAAGTVRCGGGGAAGGCVSVAMLPASILAATIAVTIGAGGAGGAAIAVDNTDGLPGVVGGQSSFGAHLVAKAVTPGGGGTAAAGVGGVTTFATFNANVGGSASGTGAAGAAGNQSGVAAGAGGAGGGITTGNVDSAGGAGGAPGWQGGVVTVGAAGTASGGAGGNGTATPVNTPHGGGGGGGGGSNSVGAGGAGGNGALYGGGGGGGGAALNGNNSGKGGDGANGFGLVTWH